MSTEQFEAEKNYQVLMSMAKSLRNKGLLTEEEYAEIDTRLKAKYQPLFGTLLSENSLQ